MPIYYKEIKLLDNSELYPFQEEILDKMMENSFNNFQLARQMGGTSLMSLYSVFYAVTHEKSSTIYVCTSANHMNAVIRRFKKIFSEFKMNWNHNYSCDHGFEFELDNGSLIYITNGKEPDYTLSETIDHLIFDNIDHLSDSDFLTKFGIVDSLIPEIWKALIPMIDISKGKVTLIGTPSGKNSFSNRLETSSLFETSTYPWYKIPDRNENWKTRTIDLIGADVFRKEFELVFD